MIVGQPYVKHLLMLGGVLVGLALGFVFSQAAQDSKFWTEHYAEIIYGTGQIGTISLMVAYMISHSLTASQMRRDIDGIGRKLDEETQRLSSDEGSANERERRIKGLKDRTDKLADRTVELRDAALDHEGRITYIEDRLKMARDRAVAKMATEGRLVGAAWKDDGFEFVPTHPDDPETK